MFCVNAPHLTKLSEFIDAILLFLQSLFLFRAVLKRTQILINEMWNCDQTKHFQGIMLLLFFIRLHLQ